MKSQSFYNIITFCITVISIFAAFFGFWGFILGLIGMFVAIKSILTPPGKLMFPIICMVFCGISIFIGFVIGMMNIFEANNESLQTQNQVIEEPQIIQEAPTIETPVDDVLDQIEEPPTETMEEYKSSCQEINYKDVLRNPDNFIGQRVKIEIKVSSVHEASWLNNTKYYFGNSYNNDYEEYWGNEYGVYDLRDTSNESWFKILEDDVIMVYGEVAGTEHTKSLILNSQELFVIDMKYAELISE